MGFFIARYICKNKNIDTTYSIGLGLVFYAALYLYFLFFNNSLLPFFTNTLIYLIGIDLLLTSFYSFKESESQHHFEIEQEELQEELQEIEDDVSDIIEIEMETMDTTETKATDTEATDTEATDTETDEFIDDTLSTMFNEYEEQQSPKEVEITIKPKRGRKKKVTISENEDIIV
jgi:hypothetical protein